MIPNVYASSYADDITTEVETLVEQGKLESWLFCGLRKGEVLALKFSDFNLKEKYVTINKQLTNEYELEGSKFGIVNHQIVEKNPKTVNSFRTLRVPDIILKELKKRKTVVAFKKEMCSAFADQDYISCQDNGKPRALGSLNLYLIRLCSRNGIRKITFHGLRHMFATILIEQGVSLAKISALLGHSSIHTTFDFYCDVMDEKEKIMAYMNHTFAVSEVQND